MHEPTTSTPPRRPESAATPGEARGIAERLFKATAQAWAAGDAPAFASHYAEGATVGLPGVLLEGRAAIGEAMGAAFVGALKGSRRTHIVRSVKLLGDSVAVVITRSATSFPGEPAIPAERAEIATWVLAKTQGTWEIAAYHSCSEAAPSA